MRDIRSDLNERAKIVQGQIKAAYAHFEKVMQQMQSERDARIAELTETLGMINKLMQFESGIEDKVVTLPHAPAANPPAANLTEAIAPTENPSAANASAGKPSLIDRIRAVNA
jgi:hypothetical protein